LASPEIASNDAQNQSITEFPGASAKNPRGQAFEKPSLKIWLKQMNSSMTSRAKDCKGRICFGLDQIVSVWPINVEKHEVKLDRNEMSMTRWM